MTFDPAEKSGGHTWNYCAEGEPGDEATPLPPSVICPLPISFSECRSWLGHCQTSWNCGTEYDFQVFQTLPVPLCANPGPDFRPPVEPGVCEYDIKQGACAFNGESEFVSITSLQLNNTP